MEAFSPPQPVIDLSTDLYYQLVHTLTGLLPVNANEADLAAQCIAARAQADDLLRLVRRHADDIGLVMRPAAAPIEVPTAVEVAPVEVARIAAPVEAAADVDQNTEKHVSENGTNSQDTAFETWLSTHPWNQGSRELGETDLREVLRAAMAKLPLAGRELPANVGESPARAE